METCVANKHLFTQHCVVKTRDQRKDNFEGSHKFNHLRINEHTHTHTHTKLLFSFSLFLSHTQTSPIQCQGDPQTILARKIADRLKDIGDEINKDKRSEEMEGLLNQIHQTVTSNLFSLSWRNVWEIFSLLSHLLKQLIKKASSGAAPHEDEMWTSFSKLWDLLIFQVTPWIRHTGGWVSHSTGKHLILPLQQSCPLLGGLKCIGTVGRVQQEHEYCSLRTLDICYERFCQLSCVQQCTLNPHRVQVCLVYS